MSVIECSWQIPYSISGIKIELLSTQSLLRIWTYWVLNDSIEKMQLLSTQFQLRIWTYWVLNLEYSISTTFLGAIEYSITPILSEHYHMDLLIIFQRIPEKELNTHGLIDPLNLCQPKFCHCWWCKSK